MFFYIRHYVEKVRKVAWDIKGPGAFFCQMYAVMENVKDAWDVQAINLKSSNGILVLMDIRENSFS